jgi:mediator of RNA polymerase II transcription subunit 6
MMLESIWFAKDEALSQVCFKDTVFLQSFGLSERNVMDYFALSQFYDPTSINEQFKMQQRFNQLSKEPTASLDRRNMKGLEFELWYFTLQPSLFVIRRQIRSSPTKGL